MKKIILVTILLATPSISWALFDSDSGYYCNTLAGIGKLTFQPKKIFAKTVILDHNTFPRRKGARSK